MSIAFHNVSANTISETNLTKEKETVWIFVEL